MNSDPYDSAAWRTFGMLDADETAIFDDAVRDDPALRKYSLEMDRLAAAIAASTAIPIDPGAGQFDRLQNRLKFNASGRFGILFAVAGWAAAIVAVVMLIIGRGGSVKESDTSPVAVLSNSAPPPPNASVKPASKVVAKRLTQEIEVLRENLEKFQHRDRVLFAEVAGLALPIVMTMNPPGVPAENPPITSLLGDAVRVAATTADGTMEEDSLNLHEETPDHPTAMPIYDSARDLGTLVVSNLPDAGENEVYNLWVITETGGKPIYVGSLPEGGAARAYSFDFSLGSTMVLPTGFILTKDPTNAPASPAENNTVLQGPPTSSK